MSADVSLFGVVSYGCLDYRRGVRSGLFVDRVQLKLVTKHVA